MVGCLAVELHKFPEEIRAMPYSDAMLLWREFEEAPPVRMTFAAYIGYKNKNKKKRKKPFVKKPINNEEFIGMQMVVGGLAPMPAAFRESIAWAEEEKKKMGFT